MIWFQLIGIAALLLDVSSLQFKYRWQILMVQAVASLTWITHFMLIGAVSGAAMNAVGLVRSLVYFRYERRRGSWAIPGSIIILAMVVAVFTWQDASSALPLLAMIIAAIAFWQKGEQVIRLILIACVPLWFSYNLMHQSYAGVASDLIALVAALIALYRYRRQGAKPASAHALPV